MTNPELQKELKDKLKEGVKPSDLKKLKKSKSDSDINPHPPTQLLQDQLKEKQKEIELLRQQLESKPTLPELDNSLIARHQNLKDWFTQYQKTKKLDTELAENIDYVSDELISQDDQIANLRTQNSQLQQQNQSLQKDLNLATKLAQLRKANPLSPHPDYLKSIVYGLIAVVLISWLFLKKPNE